MDFSYGALTLLNLFKHDEPTFINRMVLCTNWMFESAHPEVSTYCDCELFLVASGDRSNVWRNLRRCLIYSGYNSKLQWPAPFSHKGSYFSLDNSCNCLPCEQSTTSSCVPCTAKVHNVNQLLLSTPETHEDRNRVVDNYKIQYNHQMTILD